MTVVVEIAHRHVFGSVSHGVSDWGLKSAIAVAQQDTHVAVPLVPHGEVIGIYTNRSLCRYTFVAQLRGGFFPKWVR
jgi:hypothetical protein